VRLNLHGSYVEHGNQFTGRDNTDYIYMPIYGLAISKIKLCIHSRSFSQSNGNEHITDHMAILYSDHTLNPCFLKHSLCASISSWQFSSPFSTTHSSLAFLVSGHAQHGFSFFSPPPSPSPFEPGGVCCSGLIPVL